MSSFSDFLTMGIFTIFLENISICGLSHISKSKTTIERAYWIGVSVLMVVATVYFTMETSDDWDKNPISTVIEVKPISNARFPKIVVCPPKVI